MFVFFVLLFYRIETMHQLLISRTNFFTILRLYLDITCSCYFWSNFGTNVVVGWLVFLHGTIGQLWFFIRKVTRKDKASWSYRFLLELLTKIWPLNPTTSPLGRSNLTTQPHNLSTWTAKVALIGELQSWTLIEIVHWAILAYISATRYYHHYHWILSENQPFWFPRGVHLINSAEVELIAHYNCATT